MDFDFIFVTSWMEEVVKFYTKLGEKFRNKSYKVAFITVSKVGNNLLRPKNFKFFNIWDLINGNNCRIDDFYEECELIEKKYQLNSMRDFVFTELCYHGGNENERILEAIKIFKAVEDLVEKNHIDCFVQNLGAEIYRRVITCVAKYNNIPNLMMSFTPFPGRMTLITDSERHRLDELRLLDYSELNTDERNWTEKYIQDFREKKNMFAVAKVPSLIPGPRSVFRLFTEYYRKRFVNKGQEPQSLIRIKKRRLLNGIRARWVRLYYSDWPVSDKYVFFPLHTINDEQITIRAPQFYEQEYLVRLIARSLPQGYKLCVKEHPAGIGQYPLNMLKKIVEPDNVVLVPSQINSHEVIKRSSAIIVINSTVGFESLFYYKPVIVLGEAFYKGYGITIDVEYLFNLRKAIKRALTEPVNKDRTKSFIYSVYKASYDGKFGESENELTKENISKVVNSIIKKRETL